MLGIFIGLGVYYVLYFVMWDSSSLSSIVCTILGSLLFPVPLGQLGYYYAIAVTSAGTTTTPTSSTCSTS